MQIPAQNFNNTPILVFVGCIYLTVMFLLEISALNGRREKLEQILAAARRLKSED